MKAWALLLLSTGLLWSMASPIPAAEQAERRDFESGPPVAQQVEVEVKVRPERLVPLVVRLELLQLSDEAAAGLRGKTRFPRERSGSGARLLQTVHLMTLSERDALFHLGQKYPVIYYDARAEQFQIQFVDVGIKLDVMCKFESEEQFQVDVRPEFSTLRSGRSAGAPPSQVTLPETDVFTAHTRLSGVNYGESLIVARTAGRATGQHLRATGVTGLPADDNLVAVLTILKP